ncbi:MAG TPA: hypothetical protein VHO01_04375 [Jatrophihabitans sp.]|nr:hypothetical protein [Jatrophihabitans sp.]
MTDSAPERDELVEQIEAAVAELGRPQDADGIELSQLAEQLAALHSGLQSALTELDRA